MACGIAFWTKNEGRVFLVALSIITVIAVLSVKNSKDALPDIAVFLLGVLMPAALTLYYKTALAPPSEYELTADSFARMRDISRITLLSWIFVKWFLNFNEGVMAMLIILTALCWRPAPENRQYMRTAFSAAALMGCGYFIAYLSAPIEIVFNTNDSLPRLILQVWPVIVFGAFISADISPVAQFFPGIFRRKNG